MVKNTYCNSPAYAWPEYTIHILVGRLLDHVYHRTRTGRTRSDNCCVTLRAYHPDEVQDGWFRADSLARPVRALHSFGVALSK